MQIKLICTLVCSFLVLPSIKAELYDSNEGSGDPTQTFFPTDDEDETENWSGSGDNEGFVANLGKTKTTRTDVIEDEITEEPEVSNHKPSIPKSEKPIEVDVVEIDEEIVIVEEPDDGVVKTPNDSLLDSKTFLAAVIIGGCIGLICTIGVIMLLVYRMRKRDEGSYALDDKNTNFEYTKGISKEYHV